MANLCCLYGCDNRYGNCTLFHIPSKKFVKVGTPKYEWADKMERIILGNRQDSLIKSLYARDLVKMCEVHFDAKDFEMKGNRKELRVGAIPTRSMPKKSSLTTPSSRDPPKPRITGAVIKLKGLDQMFRMHVPKLWMKEKSGERIVYRLYDCHDQAKFRVDVLKNFNVSASYYGWGAGEKSFVKSLRVQETTPSQLLHQISTANVCDGVRSYIGNDAQPHTLTTSSDPHGSSVAQQRTVIARRSASCDVLMEDIGVCNACEELDKKNLKQQKLREDYAKKVENKPLQEIRIGYNLASRVKSTIKYKDERIETLEKRVVDLLAQEDQNVEIDQEFIDDFKVLFQEASDRGEVEDFYHIFWREQQKLNACLPGGERYHPEIIRFCLSLAAKSRSAYEELRESGLLRLPSLRTLNDYRHIYKASPGLQEEVLQELEKKCDSLKPHERYLALSLDEMKIKENIVYDGSSDQMVGFVDLGPSRGRKLVSASHALQFYVRSVTTNFSRPVAFFATKNVQAHELVSMLWEVIGALARCGFHIIACVADGPSCNRKTFAMMNNLSLPIPYKCRNVFDPNVPLFLICDPPHLLKTTCNNVRSSKPGGPRLLKYDDKFILWEHFRKVPFLFKTTELRSCKLTEAHFSMQSYAKMRVCYAAQLLSNSVARLMAARGGETMEKTAWFAALMNKWFDIMNTRLHYGCNKDLEPFTDKNDHRLDWLTGTFLRELEMWRSSVPKEDLSKKFLTAQTYTGLVATTKAMKELVCYILDQSPPDTYVITNRVNQDPLEAYFGSMRQIGRRSEMPDLNQYSQYESIMVGRKNTKSIKGSNVTGVIDWSGGPTSEEPLKKRKRRKNEIAKFSLST